MKVAFPPNVIVPVVGVMRGTGIVQALARTVGKIAGFSTSEDVGAMADSTLRERIAYTWVGLAGVGTVAYLLGTILVHGITVEDTGQEDTGNTPYSDVATNPEA